MHVLLSIKPEFAEKIFNGTKKYEFRRTLFKKKDIDSIIVYVSSPIKKVIGELLIDEILEEDIFELWEKTNNYSGIDENYFFNYFKGKKKGYAIKIKEAIRYKHSFDIKLLFGVNPPQSFLYIREKPNIISEKYFDYPLNGILRNHTISKLHITTALTRTRARGA